MISIHIISIDSQRTKVLIFKLIEDPRESAKSCEYLCKSTYENQFMKKKMYLWLPSRTIPLFLSAIIGVCTIPSFKIISDKFFKWCKKTFSNGFRRSIDTIIFFYVFKWKHKIICKNCNFKLGKNFYNYFWSNFRIIIAISF